ncbi:MAG: dihydroorotate dehydrogenase [Candidatus Riflebacteria bacterium]|nr:dihydroorotate dehydrogenase [Candidatus Riflebacteria bacterium]
MQKNITTKLCGLSLSSPLVLASGIMGLSASSLKRIADAGAGAVTSKSFSSEERKGHPCPAVLPFEHGYLNAVGLSNPGIEDMIFEVTEFKKRSAVPLIASIFGKSPEEFGSVTEKTAQAKPNLIEVNVSCPNVASEFGKPFVVDLRELEAVTKTVKRFSGEIPVSVKLSLQCPSITEAAKCCEQSGANAITAINTVGPGMLIDVNTHRPILSNLSGGMSGPAIFPLTVKAVYDIYESVKLPIIATGGVTSTEDALQLIMAGATAVGIGSGIHIRGINIFSQINCELAKFIQSLGIKNLEELRGSAHG